MRRQTLNKNVLKAMTIGIAAVMSVSQPMMVFAAENGTEESSNENSGSETQASSNTEGNTQEAPDVVTADEVDVATVATAEKAIDAAADSYEDLADNVESNALEAELMNEAGPKAAVDEANDILKNSESLNNADLNNALVQTAVAEGNIEKLDELLNKTTTDSKKLDDTPYLAGSDVDNENPAGPRLQYDVPRDENGDLLIDEDNCPEVGQGSAVNQLSGQYGKDPDTSDKVNLQNRSVQGTYQAGMQEIQNAITARENGNDAKEAEALEKAKEYLNACEDKFGDSTKALNEAVAYYDAAKEAADKAQASYEKVQDLVGTAISDSNAAKAQLESAKVKAEKFAAISDQYYALMLKYFKDEVRSAEFKDGELDVKASADAALEKTTNSKVTTGNGFGGDTYALGRELFEQLVMLKLEDEGAKDIKFGADKDEKDLDGTKYNQNKTEKKAVISKDSKGNDKIESYDEVGSHYHTNVDEKHGNINGRMNHTKVTYTDKNGVVQTKYYNIVYKGTDFEGTDVDLTKGICYIAEVTYDKDTKQWSYAPYSEDSAFSDDYSIYNGYREAIKAVDKAAAEVQRLTDELNNLSERVSTNKSVLEGLNDKLEAAKAAYNNSAKSLNDLRDLYNYLTEDVQPSDFIEIEEEIGDQPDVLPPSEDDGVVTDGDVIPSDVILGGGDAVTDDGADADDAGDTVVDVAGVTITIPGGNIIPAGITLAGSRVNTTIINDNEVPLSNGTATNSQNSVASPAAISTDDKILGARQNKDNSQLVKKIKDNEIPLAEIPNMDDEVTMNWMWLLIIFLLGATGKKMYDEYKKKKEAEEAAKINK